MYQKVVADVIRQFGLDVAKTGSLQKGYRNESYKLTLASGEAVNLIFHKNEVEAHRRIKAADLAAGILGQANLPVRLRFDPRTLKLSSSKKEVYVGAYTYLPGVTIPWEAYTKNHIKLLGWAMSDMHAVWRGSKPLLSTSVTDELQELLGRMERYFKAPDVSLALQQKLQLAIEVDFRSYELLISRLGTVSDAEKHILHMDLVRGNALFAARGESPWAIGDLLLSGVIDFEKATMGHPVHDIARTLAFLLVDCTSKDRSAIYKYFLQSGYNKRGASVFLQSAPIGGMSAPKVLNTLVSFFLLHDFYKFLRHTPYESLEDNHHFRRTRDILVDYGMVR